MLRKTAAASLIVSLGFLASCASSVVPNSETSPPSAVLNVAMTRPAPGKVAQFFKRDSGLNNGGCSFRLYVNGGPVADLRTSQMVVLYLDPGEYIISADSNFICSAGNTEMQIVVKAGMPRNFRLSVDAAGAMRLQPTAF